MKSILSKTKIENPIFTDQALRKLMIPLVAEQTLAITVGMADTMMISNAGEAAVSGVSLVDMINMVIFAMLSALGTGGAVVTSQYIGARKKEEACRSAKQLVYSVPIITIAIAILIYLIRVPMLKLFFGQIEDSVMEACLIYLSISCLSYPFLALYNSGAALFRAMGNSAVTLKVSVIINIINVAGNAICVFGLKMGVAGVAIPSLISRAVGAVIITLLLRNQKLDIHLPRGAYKPDLAAIRKIFYIGVPSGIENGLFQLGRVVVVAIIATFSTAQIAANGVANSLDSMGCIVGTSMNLAMITVIGQCVGAGDEAQVRYYTKKLLLINLVATAVINILMVIFLNPILSLYGLTEETTAIAYELVTFHNLLAILCWGLSFVLPNMLRACNDVQFTMWISIFSMVVFRIGFSYIFGVRMNLMAMGVWYAMACDWFFRIACFVARYLSGAWRKKAGLVE